MFCRKCGSEIPEGKYVCPACGNLEKGNAVFLSGAAVYDETARLLDVPNVLMLVLAFFVPFFGIIYYFARSSVYPVRAKAYGIASLIGLAVVAVLPIIVKTLVILL
jgi:uncharacterized membrane protein YvbJ